MKGNTKTAYLANVGRGAGGYLCEAFNRFYGTASGSIRDPSAGGDDDVVLRQDHNCNPC